MYKPSNLHNLLKYSKSMSMNKESRESMITYMLSQLTSNTPRPLHRWCHDSSEDYKDTCDVWKKVEKANRDNSYGDSTHYDILNVDKKTN